jgi:uncharacterized protein with ParB-like and HNH nuclease domain
MDRVDHAEIMVQELLNINKAGDLDLSPWYQRRSVWTAPQKGYLINTLLSGKPIPTVYIRHKIDLDKERTVREIVDGQQRIRSIFEFHEGGFAVRHPETGKRVRYEDFSPAQRKKFLTTKVSIGYLIEANDSDVIDIFGRINSVSKTLNDQEKRNANFSGEFKQFCLRQASKRVSFWRNNNIFTANEIARMAEVRFVSELSLSMLKGLSDASKKKLDALYGEFDENFPKWKTLAGRFNRVFDLLASLSDIEIGNTIFSRQPLFFSLFLVLDGKAKLSANKVSTAIHAIDERFNSDVPVAERPKKDAEFYAASTATTQRIAQRRVRQKYIESFL